MSILEIKSLSVASAQKSLVNGVNLRLQSGKITALVGKSGSGKTLSALAICGFLPPNLRCEGEILLDGAQIRNGELVRENSKKFSLSRNLFKNGSRGSGAADGAQNLGAANSVRGDISGGAGLNLRGDELAGGSANEKPQIKASANEKPRIRTSGGVGEDLKGGATKILQNGEDKILQSAAAQRGGGKIFANIMQNPRTAFNPLLSMLAHIAETMRAAGSFGEGARGEIAQTLRSVGLDESALGLYPHQLSGGQLQRVMIALALFTRARFIIADEPTTDLDLAVQSTILRLLRQIASERGIGILLITHDFGVTASIADRVAVMSEGEIVERGSVREIFAAPQQAVTKELIAAHLSLYGGELAAASGFKSTLSASSPAPMELSCAPAGSSLAPTASVHLAHDLPRLEGEPQP
nr:ATP-binding cassette domain-containing protein [uncultured Campylobacter sp.]